MLVTAIMIAVYIVLGIGFLGASLVSGRKRWEINFSKLGIACFIMAGFLLLCDLIEALVNVIAACL